MKGKSPPLPFHSQENGKEGEERGMPLRMKILDTALAVLVIKAKYFTCTCTLGLST